MEAAPELGKDTSAAQVGRDGRMAQKKLHGNSLQQMRLVLPYLEALQTVQSFGV